jgi:2-polyprenyl-3-methyl-5-hydroxy-6-metoxy-1,4-benzoquinol methylase
MSVQPFTRATSLGGYMPGRFCAGEDALHTIEAAEFGDIGGKRVLHLQCHIGRDTLCLVRRGALATGLDFSSAALDVARGLAEETGLKAHFVQGTVDEAPRLTPGRSIWSLPLGARSAGYRI